MILAMGSSMVLMAQLKPNEFGVISQIYLGLNVMTIFNLGLPNYSLLEIPKLRINNDDDKKLNQFITLTLLISITFPIIVAILYIIYKFTYYGCTQYEWFLYTIFLGLLFLKQVQVWITQIYLKSFKQIHLFSKAQIISYTLGYAILLLSCIYLSFEITLIAMSIYPLTFIFYGFLYGKKASFSFPTISQLFYYIKKSIPIFISSVVGTLGLYSNQIILTLTLTKLEAQNSMALYSNGLKVHEVLNHFNHIVYSIFIVQFKEKYESHGIDEVFKKIRNYSQMTIAILPAICCIGICLYQYISHQFLSPFYHNSYILLRLLSWNSIIMCFTTFFTMIPLVSEKLWVSTNITIIGSIILSSLSYYFIHNGYSINYLALFAFIITTSQSIFYVSYANYKTNENWKNLVTLIITLYLPVLIIGTFEYFIWIFLAKHLQYNYIFVIIQIPILITFSVLIALIFNYKGLNESLQYAKKLIKK